MTNRPVKCNSCDVIAKVIIEGNTLQKVTCPQCGG